MRDPGPESSTTLPRLEHRAGKAVEILKSNLVPDGGSPKDDEENLRGGMVDWGGRWTEGGGTCLAEEFPAPPRSDSAPMAAPPRGSPPPPNPSPLPSSSASRLCSSCQSSSGGGEEVGGVSQTELDVQTTMLLKSRSCDFSLNTHEKSQQKKPKVQLLHKI